MPDVKMLNNVDHQDLRIITKKSAAYGDNVIGSLIFPAEIAQAHKEYPIYFQKSPETGEFQLVALFGFADKENLFLTDDGWQADCIPALIQREPFMIGFQTEKGADEKKAVLHIDMDSPRISNTEEGERVFLENGGNSPYLDHINKMLSVVHGGFESCKALFSAFLELELIEPFVLEVEFKDGTQFKTDQYYTINQDKLLALDDTTVGKLHRSGHLQLAYMVLQSLSNVKRLAKKRNALS
ncbi:SapC family protein [Teredinibacter waterburyi]|uniref:SapC family protein n=1 Tax=Teredinibacter waterburyi TaxID=1500538 RepID=UPI00165EF3A7|nr:SapC family protein [Teredinibacter waterburyi]